MQFYFVTTDHLDDRIWFRDEEDFKAGMNAIPLIAAMLSISIVAFVLMSNHVHFVLRCSYAQARRFIDEFKKHHSRYLRLKYGIREALKGNKSDIRPIEGGGESMENVIAYVQMNPVAANICLQSTGYPWGTGNVFFRAEPIKGTRVVKLSKRAQIRLFHSKLPASAELLIGEGGYILPESYVDISFVETVFRTPKRMLYFLQNSSKAKLRLNSENSEIPAFRDQVIAAAVTDLCRTLFRKPSPQELSSAQQSELLRQLRYRFSAQVNQLARVVGLPYHTVATLLDAPHGGTE